MISAGRIKEIKCRSVKNAYRPPKQGYFLIERKSPKKGNF